MRTAAFCSWFVPLFVLYIVIVVGYNAAAVYRREAAERKAQQERERIAAEKREAAKMRKQERTEARRKAAEAAKQERAAMIAARPKKKRGRPRKNPPAEASEPKKRGRPCINPPAELLHAGTIPETEPNAAKTGVFAGETVAFTGSCPKLQRRYMVMHTERLGGKGYEKPSTPVARCWLWAKSPERISLKRHPAGTFPQLHGKNGGNVLSILPPLSNRKSPHLHLSPLSNSPL